MRCWSNGWRKPDDPQLVIRYCDDGTIRISRTGIILFTGMGRYLWMTINTPMPAPAWALLERQLFHANSKAAELFANKYLDERGYLLHTPRWGTLDGPDDAIETFFNWTLLHAMGGSDSVLTHYKKALEGHYKQYGELRTKLTKTAENGAIYKEFITQSDWFHTGEGIGRSCFLAFPIPTILFCGNA